MAALRRVSPDWPQDALCLALCFLFARHLRFDSADPAWPDRDRLMVDARLTPLGASLAGLAGMAPAAFESLGPVFGIGAGCALAERLLAARFGRSLVDHRAWVIASGDELARGAVQEAAQLAGSWRLGRLTAIAAVPAEDAPGLAGFGAAGWVVRRVDAADAQAIAGAISASLRSQRPTMIACIRPDRGRTWVGDVASRAEIADSEEAWNGTGRRSAGVRRAWLKRLARHGSRADFDNASCGKLPHGWHTAFSDQTPLLPPGESTVSTSWTVRRAILRLASAVPELTRVPADAWPRGQDSPANREAAADNLAQGISGIAAGLALHGGILPMAKFRLAEAEIVRGGLRAAALAQTRLLSLLIEPDTPCPSGGHRASLRSMANVSVFRPADASEALECAELALRRSTGPTVLLLSDAAVPLLADRPSRTRCAKGGYVLSEPGARMATLIASGPELHLAMAAQAVLAKAGLRAAVVSLPCWSVFARQEAQVQEAVLGEAPRIGLEAGGGFGWERWLGQRGLFIGLEHLSGIGWEAAKNPACARRIADLVLRHVGILRTV